MATMVCIVLTYLLLQHRRMSLNDWEEESEQNVNRT